MIHMFDVLDRIRANKRFSVKLLYRALGLSVDQYNYIRLHKTIPEQLIPDWVAYLELRISDLEPIYQYMRREKIYHNLDGTLSEAAKRVITDILFFHDQIVYNDIQARLLPQVLPLIMAQPYDIRNTMTDIRNECQTT